MPFYEVAAPRVIHETIEGEVVAIDLKTGAYYSIRGEGVSIWEGIDAGASTDSIAAALDIPSDRVTAFALELENEGLVTAASTGDGHEWQPTAEIRGPAALECFTDMEDLLLLDPVHDVDSRGWPSAQP